jgi:hypothetical protein
MAEKKDFDLNKAHKHFSAGCFNETWGLLDKKDRTAEDDEQMVRLTLASHYHWTQREDYDHTKASVAHWQTSRVYAVLGQAENAIRYGKLCLEVSKKEGVEPFYLGYAYEALARAEMVAGNDEKVEKYLQKAKDTAEEVANKDHKQWLLDDLATIK